MDEELLERLNKAVLIGNGKDSLMTRMALMEERVDGLKETLEKMNRYLGKITLLVLGVLLTVVLEAIMRGLK